MRETTSLLLLALVTSLLWLACQSGVRASGSAPADLRTWNWLPSRDGARLPVDAPQRDVSTLQRRVSRLIESGLERRGFERASDPDVFVLYYLSLLPRRSAVAVPRTPYLLSSYGSQGAFWIEGTDEIIRSYEDFRLVIGIVADRDRPHRHLWRGELQREIEEGADLGLGKGVREILEQLPARPAKTPEDPGPAPLREAPGLDTVLCLPDSEKKPCASAASKRSTRAKST